MNITNHITKEQFEEIVSLVSAKQIFFILPKDLKEDYKKSRLYLLTDNGRMVGCFSIVYEKENTYYAIKRACIFNDDDKHKGYGSLMVQYSFLLGLKPIGMTPWITNPISTGLAKKNGMNLQYIFNEKYGWWLKEE